MKKLLYAAAFCAVTVLAPAGASAQVMTWPGSSVGISPFSASYNYLTSPYGGYYGGYGGGYYGSSRSRYRSPHSHWDNRDKYYKRSRSSSRDRYDRYDRYDRNDRYDRGRNDRSDRHNHYSRSQYDRYGYRR